MLNAIYKSPQSCLLGTYVSIWYIGRCTNKWWQICGIIEYNFVMCGARKLKITCLFCIVRRRGHGRPVVKFTPRQRIHINKFYKFLCSTQQKLLLFDCRHSQHNTLCRQVYYIHGIIMSPWEYDVIIVTFTRFNKYSIIVLLCPSLF